MGAFDNNVFENNKKKITEHVTVHPDDIAIIDDAVSGLIKAGVGTLKDVTVGNSGVWGWDLLLTNDEEQAFYLKLSEYGSVELLRRDGPEGEVISFALYDDPDGFEFPDDLPD